ncbi:MAG: hypothetical protein QOE84_3140 [Actinomycetota bacterium]|nr:hypothetical protein [Actinomycetota bacterium]
MPGLAEPASAPTPQAPRLLAGRTTRTPTRPWRSRLDGSGEHPVEVVIVPSGAWKVIVGQEVPNDPSAHQTPATTSSTVEAAPYSSPLRLACPVTSRPRFFCSRYAGKCR